MNLGQFYVLLAVIAAAIGTTLVKVFLLHTKLAPNLKGCIPVCWEYYRNLVSTCTDHAFLDSPENSFETTKAGLIVKGPKDWRSRCMTSDRFQHLTGISDKHRGLCPTNTH